MVFDPNSQPGVIPSGPAPRPAPQPTHAVVQLVYTPAQIVRIQALYAEFINEINTYGEAFSFTTAQELSILAEYNAVQAQLANTIPPGVSDLSYYDIMASADPALVDVEVGHWDSGNGTAQVWVPESEEAAYRFWSRQLGVALQRFTTRPPDSNVGSNGIFNVEQELAYWAAHGITNHRLFDAEGNWLGL